MESSPQNKDSIKQIHAEILYASMLTRQTTSLLQAGNFDQVFYDCTSNNINRPGNMNLHIQTYKDPNESEKIVNRLIVENSNEANLMVDMVALPTPIISLHDGVNMTFFVPDNVLALIYGTQENALRPMYMQLLALHALKPWFFLQQLLTEDETGYAQSDKELDYIEYLQQQSIAIPNQYFEILKKQTLTLDSKLADENIKLDLNNPKESIQIAVNTNLRRMLVNRFATLGQYLPNEE